MIRQDYIDNITEGDIIAYLYMDDLYKGKVFEIRDESLGIRTSNGSLYYVPRETVVWVKTADYWPRGIYNALKRKNSL